MFIVGLPLEGRTRRLARSRSMGEERPCCARGRRSDKSDAPARQWLTLSRSKRYCCCKTKNMPVVKSGAQRGVYGTMVLPIPRYLSAHHARRTNWLTVRSCRPNRRKGADIWGSFRRPHTRWDRAFRSSTASLALRLYSFARQRRRPLESCSLRDARSGAALDFLNFIGRGVRAPSERSTPPRSSSAAG